MSITVRLEELARERLGLEALRPGQLEAARAAAGGRDTLCVMSTGAGKSAVYQLAGLARGGMTIVVSPLIALQRDQLEGAVPAAAMLNSTLGAAGRAELLESAAAGEIGMLLLAPEQLADEEVIEVLAGADVRLFVVDEAHCATQWGTSSVPTTSTSGARPARSAGRRSSP
ncbi:DEAD/DEAH box helicase [Paraconexibacter antarcticus]|uniref:DNA 3'-5' helicase n=1 Tax=Paraconexibacter antarcticus TaxID=2949664 RepID=A0ABY5DVS1_9ACTN|nr:DEAD/DEAH box helicase [Paraconexibacter antarcticus]UTI66095.1 DEAD/DEAH box helicase [Paraconexibacter antarcticus]